MPENVQAKYTSKIGGLKRRINLNKLLISNESLLINELTHIVVVAFFKGKRKI